MTKMIPHRVLSKKFDNDPVFKLIKERTGRSLLDEAGNFVDIECEKFHVFPLPFQDENVMETLVSNGYFDFEADSDIIYLPINAFQAYVLERSPYGDPPIDTYCEGARKFIQDIETTETFGKAKNGDKDALKMIQNELLRLQKAMRDGLDTAKLYAAYPYTDTDWQRDQAALANRTIQ